jgi:hypothetical protein
VKKTGIRGWADGIWIMERSLGGRQAWCMQHRLP